MKYILVFIFAVLAIATIAISLPRESELTTKSTESTGQVAIGGKFSLVDTNAKPVTEKDFRGRYNLVFFGFTNCPNVCLIAAQTMRELMELLDEQERKNLIPIFITLDPERDTPEKMKKWLSGYSTYFVGLTGTKQQVEDARARYKVYSQIRRTNPNDKDYLVDHSSYMYLMDPEGNYVAHFAHDIPLEELLKGIRKHIDK